MEKAKIEIGKGTERIGVRSEEATKAATDAARVAEEAKIKALATKIARMGEDY